METWIILALLAWLFAWLANFLSKFFANNWYCKNRVIFIWNLAFLFLSTIYLFIDYKPINLTFLLFILIVVRVIAMLEKNILIIESLKYIESSLFFPTHKILHLITSFFIWMLIFSEYLNWIELIAVTLWIIMIIILSNKENKKIQVDYKKWIFYLLLANLALIFASIINKYIATIDFHIPTYLFYSALIWNFYLLFTKKWILKIKDKKKFKNEAFIASLRWILWFFWFTLWMISLKTAPLVLFWVISSLTVLIPIVLSILFFNEKINTRKLIAFWIYITIIFLLTLK